MEILSLLLLIGGVGVGLYLLDLFVKMPKNYRDGIRVIAGVATLLYILQRFGVIHGLHF